MESEQVAAAFDPALLPADALQPFVALRFEHGRAGPRASTLARFTLRGAEPEGALDVDTRVRHVAHDAANDRFFAITARNFGTITPSSGRFTEVQVDPSLGDFSWPRGIAFDSRERAVVIMTSHVYTNFYRFDPRTSDWSRLPAEIRGLSLVALAYAEEPGCLFALERGHRDAALHTLHRFNDLGASLGTLRLDPPIPVSRDQVEYFQLQYSSGKLVLIVPSFPPDAEDTGATAPRAEDRVFVVDPANGRVHAVEGFVPVQLAHERR
jgi:hypothetical protein